MNEDKWEFWIDSCNFIIIYARVLLFSRADNGRSLNDIESTLPAETEAKEAAIDQAILDRTSKFLSTHTVELSLPEEVSRSFDEGKIINKKILIRKIGVSRWLL